MLKEIYLLVFLLCTSIARTPHSHILDSKERVEDGSYSRHYPEGKHNPDFDHEAILGSVKEAEEFDKLSPEESKTRLAILVTKMDMNKDQFVDRHELKAWILRSFKMLTEEESNEKFEEYDANDDGKLTWAEYIHEVYDMDNDSDNEINDVNEEETKLRMDDEQMFKAADSNNDGALDINEYTKFQSPEEHAEMLPLILEQTLRDKDINKDGKIDFQEFIGAEGRDHDKQWLLAEKDRFDNDFDQDKDGILNGNEILSWVVPSNDEVAEEEVNHLFAAADDDHDDRLSYSEIIENYETFVGSEATDYGDHLQNIHHFSDEL